MKKERKKVRKAWGKEKEGKSNEGQEERMKEREYGKMKRINKEEERMKKGKKILFKKNLPCKGKQGIMDCRHGCGC